MKTRLLRLALWFYALMAVAGLAGHVVWRLAAPSVGGAEAPALPQTANPLLTFDLWIRAGWQGRFWVIVGLNLLLCVGAAWLTVFWRPAGALFLGIFGFVMGLGSFATECVGLFVAFLPTLVLETLAVLLCISAGLTLHERRAAAGRAGRWLAPSDAWVLLAALFCLIPAGLYEAYFIATFLPLP
jgi:hypothetical protein